MGPAAAAAGLQAWYGTALGRSLAAMELRRLRGLLERLYGPLAVQVGALGAWSPLDACRASIRLVVDPRPGTPGAALAARPDALPFEAKAIPMLLLPHVLEFYPRPHAVLREVERVLMPEGHVIILGFNPWSLWGLRRRLHRRRGRLPWTGQFLRLGRIKDWLVLLGFEVSGGGMLYYRPPLAQAGLRRRLGFLEPAGDRWWPLLAGAYILVARKREPGLTPLQPEWRRNGVRAPALVKPVARACRRG